MSPYLRIPLRLIHLAAVLIVGGLQVVWVFAKSAVLFVYVVVAAFVGVNVKAAIIDSVASKYLKDDD